MVLYFIFFRPLLTYSHFVSPLPHLPLSLQFLSLFLSFLLPIYLSNHLLFIYLSMYLSIYPYIYVSIYLCIYQSIYVTIYLSIYLCIYQSIYVTIYLYINLCMYLSIYLSMHLSNYLTIYLCIFGCSHSFSVNSPTKFISYPPSASFHPPSLSHFIHFPFLHLLRYSRVPQNSPVRRKHTERHPKEIRIMFLF